MNFLIIGFMSIMCCLDISSYSLYIIITVSSIPVPLPNAPVKSAIEAKNPTAIAPMIVRGPIYLCSIFSKTRMSCLNPGICSPDAIICLAWLFASIPLVCTQNHENTTAPIIINVM